MKKKKQRKLDWADLACQEAMDRTLKVITVKRSVIVYYIRVMFC